MEKQQLTRSSDQKFLGVAAGIAEYFNLDVSIVRLIFVLFTLMGGPGLIVYLLMALLMPSADSAETSHPHAPA